MSCPDSVSGESGESNDNKTKPDNANDCGNSNNDGTPLFETHSKVEKDSIETTLAGVIDKFDSVEDDNKVSVCPNKDEISDVELSSCKTASATIACEGGPGGAVEIAKNENSVQNVDEESPILDGESGKLPQDSTSPVGDVAIENSDAVENVDVDPESTLSVVAEEESEKGKQEKLERDDSLSLSLDYVGIAASVDPHRDSSEGGSKEAAADKTFLDDDGTTPPPPPHIAAAAISEVKSVGDDEEEEEKEEKPLSISTIDSDA